MYFLSARVGQVSIYPQMLLLPLDIPPKMAPACFAFMFLFCFGGLQHRILNGERCAPLERGQNT